MNTGLFASKDPKNYAYREGGCELENLWIIIGSWQVLVAAVAFFLIASLIIYFAGSGQRRYKKYRRK